MMGSAGRKEVTEQVTKAVRSAGGLVVAALAVACTALVVALAALVLGIRGAHA